MYETRRQKLAHPVTFFKRLLRSLGLGFLAIFFAQLIGMLGYHFLEKMPWVDAFVNAAMILSGMGPMGALTTTNGKIFAGCYALFSGLAFILIVGLIFAPILHRLFHRFHLENDDDSE